MSNNIWEDTLVLAFRDLQWLKNVKNLKENETARDNNIKKGNFGPIEMLFKFDGHAESLLGDTLASVEERFFLIEFKGNSTQLKSEWEGKSKRLYMFMHVLCKEMKASISDVKKYNCMDVILRTSLTAHYIAYWSMSEVRIVCEPYISGLADAATKVDSKEKPKHLLADYIYLLKSTDAKISAENLLNDFKNNKCIPYSKANEVGSIERGLSSVAMKKYIEWLIGENNLKADIRGIIVDNEGHTRAIFSSAKDLVEVANKMNGAMKVIKNTLSPNGKMSKSEIKTEEIPDIVFKNLKDDALEEISKISNCLRTLAEIEYCSNINSLKAKNSKK